MVEDKIKFACPCPLTVSDWIQYLSFILGLGIKHNFEIQTYKLSRFTMGISMVAIFVATSSIIISRGGPKDIPFVIILVSILLALIFLYFVNIEKIRPSEKLLKESESAEALLNRIILGEFKDNSDLIRIEWTKYLKGIYVAK